MKTISFFFFLVLSFSVHAQSVLSCGYGNYVSMPVDFFVYPLGTTVDFDEINNEVVLEVTVFETQGGGGGFIDPVVASLFVEFEEDGVFSCDRNFPFNWFGCMSLEIRLNGSLVSSNDMSHGIVVQSGNLLEINMIYSGSVGCSGSYEIELSDFRLELDCSSGCTYLHATNFNPSAVVDDGSCEFSVCSVTADLDGDGTVGVTDLMLFLTQFGS